jgi:hypothetical protein
MFSSKSSGRMVKKDFDEDQLLNRNTVAYWN